MPTTSANGRYTVPAPTDPPDVPYWMKSLADQVEAGRTGAGSGKLHIQLYGSMTTDAGGFISYTHAAGFTPVAVLLIPTQAGSNWGTFWGSDSYTSTNFRGRFHYANGNGPLASQATGSVVALIFG